MKIFFFILSGVMSMQLLQAQLKTTAICPPFVVDVLEGTVNEIHTYSNIGEIEKKFPCFSTATEETNGSTCGGVFYKDKDIYFFTERDYIEVGEHFKGKLSLPLLGAGRGSLFNTLGNPKIKDVSWDAYQTKYGILILYYNKAGKINKLQLSNKRTDTLKLCE
ncbi:MAG: hypothetical protein H7320_22430 [Ferruginibacter sp.]|nr:hypothetical protein [Ferruginibacter sp.]